MNGFVASNGNISYAQPSPAAQRMARTRQRRREGLVWLGIDLRRMEVEALGVPAESRNDPEALREALYRHLDRTLGEKR